jgi:hypothetical protein
MMHEIAMRFRLSVEDSDAKATIIVGARYRLTCQ